MLGKANAVVLCFVLQLFHCVFLIGSHQSGGGGGQKSMSSDKATSQAAAGSSSMGKWTQNLGVLFFPSIHTLAYNLYAFIPLLDIKLLRMEAEDLCCRFHVSQCHICSCPQRSLWTQTHSPLPTTALQLHHEAGCFFHPPVRADRGSALNSELQLKVRFN